MTIIDEIEELRAELRHCLLTTDERRQAEISLDQLLRAREDANPTKATHRAAAVSARSRG